MGPDPLRGRAVPAGTAMTDPDPDATTCRWRSCTRSPRSSWSSCSSRTPSGTQNLRCWTRTARATPSRSSASGDRGRYGLGRDGQRRQRGRTDDRFPYSSYVHDSGTASHIPDLYLPWTATRFNALARRHHDLGVPAFPHEMDVIPGRVNHCSITDGDRRVRRQVLRGSAAPHHSRMLFNVHVVSQDRLRRHLKALAGRRHGDRPSRGCSAATTHTQVGLSENRGRNLVTATAAAPTSVAAPAVPLIAEQQLGGCSRRPITS